MEKQEPATTLCGLRGWRPEWIQRFARKEVSLLWSSEHDARLDLTAADLRAAVLGAGRGAGDGLHLPLLRPHHHRAAVRHQVPGGSLDLLRQRGQPDRLHLRPPLPHQTTEEDHVDLGGPDRLRGEQSYNIYTISTHYLYNIYNIYTISRWASSCVRCPTWCGTRLSTRAAGRHSQGRTINNLIIII